MPGLSSEQTDPISWRKRKRDHQDGVTLTCSTSFVPFPYRVDLPDQPNGCQLPLSKHPYSSTREVGDLSSCRPRCLPRKRRHVQPLSIPPYQQPFQQGHLDDLSYPSHSPKLLFPNVYSTPTDLCSPPVSPKTIVPLSYQSASASSLRPCHICYRKPTTRGVLDAYADCDLCRQRACYICVRQCDSPVCTGQETHDPSFDEGGSTIQRKICSSCAVEGLTEAGVETVRCLECVRQAPWSQNLNWVQHASMNE
ncbi:hypothetical protein N7474_010225 [Penicillium riverlandense]|uniref:uncharacterized protein n=1 Tax=Penicillium riverlandense TaxID=1903569 RepID=UPI0025471B34|nr:uncharacterized protein N7474_010225 [Penicillium riverlandense]KAJ5808956.1 hypothetical protein N7474_010225 [Penicillium riverlandense]